MGNCFSKKDSNLVRTDTDIEVAARAWANPATRAAAEITYGHISDWDTSQVTNMEKLFCGYVRVGGDANMQSFNDDISRWDTSNVTTMYYMFSHAYAFNGDLSRWNTSNVITMRKMFSSAHIFNGDLSNWVTSNVNSMYCMFWEAKAFNGDISGWNTSKVSNMGGMFCEAISFNRDLHGWDTSNVITMNSMFKEAWNFNGDISGWDTSKVTTMEYMFWDAQDFNGDLSRWDTSNVTTMHYMFCHARAFNGDLSRWDTSNVTSMQVMFQDCPIEANHKAHSQQYVVVAKENYSIARTFYQIRKKNYIINCDFIQDVLGPMMESPKLVRTDADLKIALRAWANPATLAAAKITYGHISNWDTSRVTNMEFLFCGCKDHEEYIDMSEFDFDLSQWDTSNVKKRMNMLWYIGKPNETNSKFLSSIEQWKCRLILADDWAEVHYN